jgi:hypothetical protein
MKLLPTFSFHQNYFNNLDEIENFLKETTWKKKYTFFPRYHVYLYEPDKVLGIKGLGIDKLYNGFFGTCLGSKQETIGDIIFVIKKEIKTVEIIDWDFNHKFMLSYYNYIRSKYPNIGLLELYNRNVMLSKSAEVKVKKLLLLYVENQAKKNGCNIIIRNVHSDTDEYNDLKDNGYILTNDTTKKKYLKTYKHIEE